MASASDVYRQRTGGRAFGRPVNGVESPYVLTGLGTCAACGGSMAVLKRAHGSFGNRRQVPFYGCMTRHLRGDAICRNALEVPLVNAELAVLDAVKRDVLNIAVLETSLQKALATLEAPPDHETQAHGLREELARIEGEVGRLAAAIAAGGDLPSVLALLQDRERRRVNLRAELVAIERQAVGRRGARDVEQALTMMRDALTDWKGLLHAQPTAARQALRALLAGRLIFAAEERDGERFYTFTGQGTITPLIAGVTGVQRVWWPQRDSNPCFSLERAVS
jgi:hypothetical protein